MDYVLKRFKNGNMSFRIIGQYDECSTDDIKECFLNAVYDHDCEILGNPFCLSNFEMGIYLYSYYMDKKYLVPFSDFDKIKNGQCVKFYAENLAKDDRKMA